MMKNLRNEKGFSTVWLLGFAIIILLCGFLIFDMTRVYMEREKLVSAADAAANAGATAIDENALPDVKLDPVAAIDRCNAMLQTYAGPDGAARSVLDPPGSTSNSGCEIDPNDASGKSIQAVATGKVSFSFLFSVLGVDSRELKVTSRSRPSCSDSENC